uniref:Uncharacterized protein n=1 Tax=Meleagris gallopavo TaxID=9103 RepID=A0A803XTN5_MELGA
MCNSNVGLKKYLANALYFSVSEERKRSLMLTACELQQPEMAVMRGRRCCAAAFGSCLGSPLHHSPPVHPSWRPHAVLNGKPLCTGSSGSEGGGSEEEAAALHRSLQVPAQLTQPFVCLRSLHPFCSHQPGHQRRRSLQRLLLLGALHPQHQPAGAADRDHRCLQHTHPHPQAVQAALQHLHVSEGRGRRAGQEGAGVQGGQHRQREGHPHEAGAILPAPFPRVPPAPPCAQCWIRGARSTLRLWSVSERGCGGRQRRAAGAGGDWDGSVWSRGG